MVPVQRPLAGVRRVHVNLAKPCVDSFVVSMTPEELELPFVDPAAVDVNLDFEAP